MGWGWGGVGGGGGCSPHTYTSVPFFPFPTVVPSFSGLSCHSPSPPTAASPPAPPCMPPLPFKNDLFQQSTPHRNQHQINSIVHCDRQWHREVDWFWHMGSENYRQTHIPGIHVQCITAINKKRTKAGTRSPSATGLIKWKGPEVYTGNQMIPSSSFFFLLHFSFI